MTTAPEAARSESTQRPRSSHNTNKSMIDLTKSNASLMIPCFFAGLSISTHRRKASRSLGLAPPLHTHKSGSTLIRLQHSKQAWGPQSIKPKTGPFGGKAFLASLSPSLPIPFFWSADPLRLAWPVSASFPTSPQPFLTHISPMHAHTSPKLCTNIFLKCQKGKGIRLKRAPPPPLPSSV